MNKKLTEIACILDRSGSMGPMIEPAIAGFNQLLREQTAAPGSARISLVLFDNECLLPWATPEERPMAGDAGVITIAPQELQ